MQTPLEQLCNEMVDADIAMQARALPLKNLNAGPAAARRTAAGCPGRMPAARPSEEGGAAVCAAVPA